MEKTPEEIKRGLKLCSHEGHGEEIICEHCPYDSNSCAVLICTRRLSADALAYIQQLEAQVPRWISVEERLPGIKASSPYFQHVIVLTKNKEVLPGLCSNGRWYVMRDEYAYCTGAYDGEVTHWRPMPEPPEEDEHAD